MISPDDLGRGLETVFRRIQRDRMQGLPILNPALRVKAVGFREWEGHSLGILVTPWFINLMLLPGDGDDWRPLRVGDKQSYRLPSGPYEFILGEEPGIGRYQMCSLFSPVLEFVDRETAEATAEAAMAALMDEGNRDAVSTREREIERRWRGAPEQEPDGTSESKPIPSNEPVGLADRLEQPLSRRELLRGRLAREPQP